MVARHLLAGHDRDRARVALLAAAEDHETAHAYRDAARLLTTALDEWTAGTDEAARSGALDRLAHCAELSGDHATAIASLRELLDQAGRPDPGLLGRLAVQHELLGQWSPALAAREDAAAAYDDQGRPGDAAAERLAVAAHLRSAASFRAALDLLDVAEAGAQTADRTDLLCRIRGLRGNTLVRQGRAAEGLPKVREALDLALTQGLAGPAAEVYQRLADSLEHTGDYRAAGRAYESAYEFCRLHEQDTAGQLCRACATVVMFQSGRWDQALAASAEVLADPASIPHARAAASAVVGLVDAFRGRPRAARSALLDARATGQRIELVPVRAVVVLGPGPAGRAGRPGRPGRGRLPVRGGPLPGDRGAALLRAGAAARGRTSSPVWACATTWARRPPCWPRREPAAASRSHG